MLRRRWPAMDQRVKAHVAYESQQRESCPRDRVGSDECKLRGRARDAQSCGQLAGQHHRNRHHLPGAKKCEAAGQDLTAVEDRVVVEEMGGTADLEPVRGDPCCGNHRKPDGQVGLEPPSASG